MTSSLDYKIDSLLMDILEKQINGNQSSEDRIQQAREQLKKLVRDYDKVQKRR